MTEQQQLEAGIAALEASGRRWVMRWSIAAIGGCAPSWPRCRRARAVGARADAQAGQHPVSRRGRLHRARPAPRPRGDQRSDGRRLVAWNGRRPGARAARSCKYAGDNLLAVFGADEAARRRCRACRALRPGAARTRQGLGAEVRAAHGHAGFNVRVGIHTGGVLLGGGVDAEGSIRGIAVNIAARMEQTAPAGALRISHDAYAQVRGMFEVERQEPLAVKGVDEPIQSYLVLRAKATELSPRQPRHRRRGHADDRPGRRTRSASGRLQAAVHRSQSRRRHRGGRCRHRQEPVALRVRSLERRTPGELLPLPRPRHAADARPALRTPARHHRLALPDRRRRQHRDGAPEDGAGHRPAVPGRRRSRLVGRTCPSARPSDRHRVARESPRQGHPRRPQADPQPRVPRRGAAVPSHRQRPTVHPSSCSSKTCTGPTTRAWTSSPTWRRSTAMCRC